MEIRGLEGFSAARDIRCTRKWRLGCAWEMRACNSAACLEKLQNYVLCTMIGSCDEQ